MNVVAVVWFGMLGSAIVLIVGAWRWRKRRRLLLYLAAGLLICCGFAAILSIGVLVLAAGVVCATVASRQPV